MDKKELYAYLAGIIDGEGSLMIRKSTWRLGKDMQNPQYNARVGFKMNREELPKIFKKTFGGHYHKDKKVYQSKNGFKTNKPMYCYNAEHNLAYKIVDAVYPYLVLKKQQADLILELRKTKEMPERKSSGEFHGQPYSPAFIQKLENLYLKINLLNSGSTFSQDSDAQ